MRLAALLLVTGCAQVGHYVPQISAGIAATATACDWRQTHLAAMAEWHGTWESNPVLGTRPDSSTVDGYFSFVLGGEAVAGAFSSRLPGNWRYVGVAVMVAIAALEMREVMFNSSTSGFCI